MKDKSDRKYSNIRVEYKVSVYSEKGDEILTDTIYEILKKIESLGSLKAVAEELGISYRKVWGDLKDVENVLGFSLIHKTRGGERGGSTILTDDGEKFISAYDKLHSDIDISVNDYIIDFKKTLKSK